MQGQGLAIAILAMFLSFACHVGDLQPPAASDPCCEADAGCAAECADVCPSCVCCADLIPATLATATCDLPARKLHFRDVEPAHFLVPPIPSEIPHVPRTIKFGA